VLCSPLEPRRSFVPDWEGTLNRRIVATALTLLCGLAPSAIWSASALAQAGSTGGSLGKTDKSISGEEEAPQRPKPKPAPRPKKATVEAAPVVERPPPVVSLSGGWGYTVDCPASASALAKHNVGDFTLAEMSPGEIKVVFADPLSAAASATLNDGRLTFTRNVAWVTQHWFGQVADGGRRLTGSITGPESCTWEANKH
jgi:hypothetical protein